jgi:hypothetical protein
MFSTVCFSLPFKGLPFLCFFVDGPVTACTMKTHQQLLIVMHIKFIMKYVLVIISNLSTF